LSPEEIRQRAAAGQAKRRNMKKGMRAQALPGAMHADAVGALVAAAFCVLLTAGGGAWCKMKYGTNRADIVEVFGGYGEVSVQAHRQGFFCLQPYDSQYGCDLRDEQQATSMEEDIMRWILA